MRWSLDATSAADVVERRRRVGEHACAGDVHVGDAVLEVEELGVECAQAFHRPAPITATRAAGPARARHRGRAPPRSPRARQAISASGSGTAPVSVLIPMLHVPQYESSVTLSAAADRRPERVEAADPCPADEDRRVEAGHVARQEVDVLQHAADHAGREQVEQPGDGVGERDRGLGAARGGAVVEDADAAADVRRRRSAPGSASA